MINNEERIKYGAYLIIKVLDIDYEDIMKNIELKKKDLDRRKVKSKGRKVDFVVEINNKIINIEMNNNASYMTMIRNFKYATIYIKGT